MIVLTFIFILSIFTAACSGNETTKKVEKGEKGTLSEPQKGGSLVIGSTSTPTILNSLYSTDSTSSDMEAFIYNALLKTNEKFEEDYDLAEDVEESPDGLTYTVKIRKGVKFHDGVELTADDVVFTYNIPLHPDYNGERGTNFEMLKEIKKLDNYTVEFKLKRKDATFKPNTLSSFHILPEHILKDVPVKDLGKNKFNFKSPIGTGPYKFVEWKEGEYLKFEAFDDYYDGRANLDTLTVKIIPDGNAAIAQLQAGDINFFPGVTSMDLDTVKGFNGLKVESGLGLSYSFIGWNQKKEMFKDKNVRHALTMAIDRQEIVDTIMNGDGEVAHVPESPLSWAYSDEVRKFKYDPEEAKTLLKAAGWKDTDKDGYLVKDGKRFSFTLKTNKGNKLREDAVVVIQQQLKEIGIEVKPQIVENSALIKQLMPPNWDYDAVVMGWSLSTFPDTYDIFHSSQIERGFDFVWYKNEKADKLMIDARQILDRDEYKNAYIDIYKEIAEDQPYTFLYYPNVHHAMPENLHRPVFHAKQDFYQIEKWWLEQK
ncbi:peptide-binding protein [Heyndrickxia sp. NPDC080065]|uniref:peptide-binding protein n=1 Tax=Heyndrickxia sp. NPDC080065 TaxID=3390568 RepID=UPI003D033291